MSYLILSSTFNAIEIIGIIASVVIILSFLFSKEILIRTVNIIGAIVFVVYGFLNNAISVWVLNIMLIVVHVVYIFLYFYKKKNKKNISTTEKLLYLQENLDNLNKEEIKTKLSEIQEDLKGK